MQRRDFLKASGLAALSLSMSPAFGTSGAAPPGISQAGGGNRPIDVKVNIKPICSSRVHLEAYEGPCRWGEAGEPEDIGERAAWDHGRPLDALTREAELEDAKQSCDRFVRSIEENLTDEGHMLDPAFITFHEGDVISDADWKKLEADLDQTDVFLITYRVPGIEKYKKPVMMLGEGITNVDIAAYMRSLGLEGYAPYDWEELNQLVRLLQVRKAVQHTRLLVVSDRADQLPYGVYSVCSLESMKTRFGMDSTVVSYEEFFNEMPRISGDSREKSAIENLTRSLVNNARNVHMDQNYIRNDVTFYRTVRRLMEKYGCSAFTIRCFELCGSRIPARKNFVPCLTHSLLKDAGVPSGCEGDTNALLAMMIAMYVSKKSAYMGNPTFDREKDIVRIHHDVPGLKMRGFQTPDLEYELRSFTSGGWGTTVRYDFSLDAGQTVTLARFDPTAAKLLISAGIIIEGFGVNKVGCSMGVHIKVPNAADFFEKQKITGHHLAMVYSDITGELKAAGEIMNFEVMEIT